jgi:hypothetical protein
VRLRTAHRVQKRTARAHRTVHAGSMKTLIIAVLAMAVSTSCFGMAQTQLDRCYLGQPERFSEPP